MRRLALVVAAAACSGAPRARMPAPLTESPSVPLPRIGERVVLARAGAIRAAADGAPLAIDEPRFDRDATAAVLAVTAARTRVAIAASSLRFAVWIDTADVATVVTRAAVLAQEAGAPPWPDGAGVWFRAGSSIAVDARAGDGWAVRYPAVADPISVEVAGVLPDDAVGRSYRDGHRDDDAGARAVLARRLPSDGEMTIGSTRLQLRPGGPSFASIPDLTYAIVLAQGGGHAHVIIDDDHLRATGWLPDRAFEDDPPAPVVSALDDTRYGYWPGGPAGPRGPLLPVGTCVFDASGTVPLGETTEPFYRGTTPHGDRAWAVEATTPWGTLPLVVREIETSPPDAPRYLACRTALAPSR